MSEFSGLSSHLKRKVRRQKSYQLVHTINIVFLCKGLRYQLSDTSLRDDFFCFCFGFCLFVLFHFLLFLFWFLFFVLFNFSSFSSFFIFHHLSQRHIFLKRRAVQSARWSFQTLLTYSSLILCCFRESLCLHPPLYGCTRWICPPSSPPAQL